MFRQSVAINHTHNDQLEEQNNIITNNILANRNAASVITGANETFQYDDEFSSDAKNLLGQRIPINRVLVFKSPINKLAICFAEKSGNYSPGDIEILKLITQNISLSLVR